MLLFYSELWVIELEVKAKHTLPMGVPSVVSPTIYSLAFTNAIVFIQTDVGVIFKPKKMYLCDMLHFVKVLHVGYLRHRHAPEAPAPEAVWLSTAK